MRFCLHPGTHTMLNPGSRGGGTLILMAAARGGSRGGGSMRRGRAAAAAMATATAPRLNYLVGRRRCTGRPFGQSEGAVTAAPMKDLLPQGGWVPGSVSHTARVQPAQSALCATARVPTVQSGRSPWGFPSIPARRWGCPP